MKGTNEATASAFSFGVEAESNNGTLFVDVVNGVTIAYSYGKHFPIAIKFKDYGVFFNSDGYSTTTAKHKTLIRRQIGDENLSDSDFKTTKEMCLIDDKIRFNDVTTKAELIEMKI